MTFSMYETLDELTLFTEAMRNWCYRALKPDYMNIYFKALYHMTNEISCKFYQKHGRYPLHSFKKWGVLCNAFLAEAKRFKSGHLPKAEDYLKNGIHEINPSSGVNAMMVHRFFLLGQSITKESVEPLNGTLEIASSTAAILRLWEDLGSAEVIIYN
ncbi:hypothetical protein TB1_005143 [Malus domestica]